MIIILFLNCLKIVHTKSNIKVIPYKNVKCQKFGAVFLPGLYVYYHGNLR